MAGKTIAEYEMGDTTREKLLFPKRLNQQHKLEKYSIDACSEDQKKYYLTFYSISKSAMKLPTISNLQQNVTPLRMILCGVAGSGKSTLINTLVTAIRKITGKTSSVYVCGPTGSAAFNAGGETYHRLFNIQSRFYNCELSAQTLKTFISKLEDTIALIVDERSMISALLLGTMEAYCKQAAFKGAKSHPPKLGRTANCCPGRR